MRSDLMNLKCMIGVAVGEAGLELDDVGVVEFFDDFTRKGRVGRDRPFHILNGDFGIGAITAAFGVEEIEIYDIASRESDTKRVIGGLVVSDEKIIEIGIALVIGGADDFHALGEFFGTVGDIANAINVRIDGAVSIDDKPSAEWLMETADIEDELIVQEDPNVIIAREYKTFLSAGGNTYGDAEVSGEMEVVHFAISTAELDVSFVETRDIVEWIDMLATVNVGGAIAGTIESNGVAFDLFRETVNIVKPTVEIVARENWIVPRNVGGKNVVIGLPGRVAIAVGRDRKSIVAECVLDDALESAFGPVMAFTPLELTVGGVASVDALIPIGDRYSDSIRGFD